MAQVRVNRVEACESLHEWPCVRFDGLDHGPPTRLVVGIWSEVIRGLRSQSDEIDGPNGGSLGLCELFVELRESQMDNANGDPRDMGSIGSCPMLRDRDLAHCLVSCIEATREDTPPHTRVAGLLELAGNSLQRILEKELSLRAEVRPHDRGGYDRRLLRIEADETVLTRQPGDEWHYLADHVEPDTDG